MQSITTLADHMGQMPLEYLTIFVALAALGLAAFAIHAVLSIAKKRAGE